VRDDRKLRAGQCTRVFSGTFASVIAVELETTTFSSRRWVRTMRSPAAGPRVMILDLSLFIPPPELGRRGPGYKSYRVHSKIDIQPRRLWWSQLATNADRAAGADPTSIGIYVKSSHIIECHFSRPAWNLTAAADQPQK